MSARLLLISSDEAVAKVVRSAIGNTVSVMVFDHLPDVSLDDTYQPSGILIDSDARIGVQTAFEKIAAAKRRFPSAPVIVLGNEMSAQLVLAALRAGADEFVDRQAGPEQLNLAISSCLDKVEEPSYAPRAKIVGVLSALGSEQDQDFAVNLAVRAASRSPDEMTLYIDLSIPATQSSIALGVEAEFDVMSAIREVARVDRALLESALARDPRSGLCVMPLCAKFDSNVPSFEAASFAALLQVLRSCCGTIVINYGPFSRQRGLLEMVRPGARFFVCCNQRFPSIRGASDLLRWFSENGMGVPDVVVHMLAPGRTPSAIDIRKALNISSSIDLDVSWASLADSVNAARPLALSETRYSHRLDQCLARIGIVPEPEPDFLAQFRRWLRPGAAVATS